jgi:hypothetical protein
MSPATLPQVQSWFQAVVTHPGGMPAGWAAPGTATGLQVAAEQLESVLTRSATQTAAEWLGIYARGYYLRLLEGGPAQPAAGRRRRWSSRR